MSGPALALALVAGCVAGCSAPGTANAARVTVSPRISVADQAIRIRVTGLPARQQATVQVSSADAADVQWQASAGYRADAAGDIDLNSAFAVSGSYSGISDMGLIWSMRPTGHDQTGSYFWDGQPLTFTVSVGVNGKQIASARFQRTFSRVPLTQHSESLEADGFIGQYWQPPMTGPLRTAVLVVGGSEGGLPVLLPPLLASNGYPALGIAYFKEPGLPQSLSRIPLEYFAKALTWLAHQPGVNPGRVAVLGVSRGSEAAQLLGVYYPGLVHAVIASVPSNVALCSYPGCAGPAWTLHGKALPYTSQIDNPQPSDDPAAVIPDQRITGPVFLDCGGYDATWTSCPYAQAILNLLNAHHDPWAHVLYAYPEAGHPVGSLVPYQPQAMSSPAQWDLTYQADQEGDARLWPHLLSFLAALAASRPT